MQLLNKIYDYRGTILLVVIGVLITLYFTVFKTKCISCLQEPCNCELVHEKYKLERKAYVEMNNNYIKEYKKKILESYQQIIDNFNYSFDSSNYIPSDEEILWQHNNSPNIYKSKGQIIEYTLDSKYKHIIDNTNNFAILLDLNHVIILSSLYYETKTKILNFLYIDFIFKRNNNNNNNSFEGEWSFVNDNTEILLSFNNNNIIMYRPDYDYKTETTINRKYENTYTSDDNIIIRNIKTELNNNIPYEKFIYNKKKDTIHVVKLILIRQ